VFAGVRKPTDGDSIAAEHPNIHFIILDVTDGSSIKAALAAVQQFTVEKGLPFVAVVANAGIAKEAPLEFLPMSDVRDVLEVNFFGALALVQAFMPLVRQHKGRVIFVSSFVAKMPCPELGAYAASKAAMNAAADCLRVEVALHGVSVSNIIPGTVNTGIFAKHFDYTTPLHAARPEIRQLYPATHWAATLEVCDRWAVSTAATDAAILHSIASSYPNVEYFVGRAGSPLSAGLTYRMMSLLPIRLLDCIKGQTYH
jgi:NAD(P)-dependent dehydrogenase (short-subunit alcohol dehydrogenase family)